MEIQRAIRYTTRGRAQVALSNQSIHSGHTLDISVGGVCILLDDKIPVNESCLIRFEMVVNGKIEIIVAKTKSIYGVFASHGGFRVGFQFNENDPNRTALIKKLAGKRPMVDQPEHESMQVAGQPTDF